MLYYIKKLRKFPYSFYKIIYYYFINLYAFNTLAAIEWFAYSEASYLVNWTY